MDSYSLPSHGKKPSPVLGKIQSFENKSGARIDVILNIAGDHEQREKALTLIKETVENASFIPKYGNFILPESNLNTKFEFVRFDEFDRYFIKKEKSNEGELERKLDELQIAQNTTTLSNFTSFDNLTPCLNQLLSTPSNNDKYILKPRIFFGKCLFFEIKSPEKPFTLQEWLEFRLLPRTRRGDDDRIGSSEFNQDAPTFLENFEKLKNHFEFKEDEKKVAKGEFKGTSYIYYDVEPNVKRKLKLRWNVDEKKWKISKHIRNYNRLANFDFLSGSKIPDFRLSAKTHFEILPKTFNAEWFENVQTDIPGLWYKKINPNIKNLVVRQVIEKRRFSNKCYKLTFSTIRQEDKKGIQNQGFITLKHHSWSQDEIDLNNNEHFNNVVNAIHFAKEILSQI
ncbi:11085_t:CDS:2 [Funneliformis geosporum]|uniref:11472_t:CDS:1 n=1 Tax=Funneliformis geosporum TaxID=1117311 RepID=A0A9W4ST93_9GLOM|nr:11085_t:CDS:2 [Funneliformis geosporum]CAI2179763.1 11472_t:CDS:2 [Funneliformis geosporum]